ncbi:uncharacterized protein BBA_00225 [Beauveria bassiana ARSEF 2860]|uniref:C2H2-type domain-containing protein n=1 Tax=Beauveria bassiana (strain ARSEF 2860) TaxID=655819 RepID=J4WLI5_BEAB2|nr:uncharacterized protein BBA_00225 [Beauveria bassiana ARSEF 2860]EJP70595.1 hypothetical protein BBA_00225 [Beauveria bassiana ARSEF 2860]
MGLFDNVSEKHLRAVLRALCKDTDICAKALAMVDKLEKAEGSAMADNNVGESEAKLAICIRCEKAFSVDDDEDYDCVYHNGKSVNKLQRIRANSAPRIPIADGRVNVVGDLYPDEDDPAWYDHDVRCHGDLDTPENRKKYPEAFLWDCCDEVSTTEGCKMGRHRVEPGQEDSDSSEDSEDFESD